MQVQFLQKFAYIILYLYVCVRKQTNLFFCPFYEVIFVHINNDFSIYFLNFQTWPLFLKK